VDGQPLDRILEKGAVPFPRACAWIGGHRPCAQRRASQGRHPRRREAGNILITADGRVKLSDFGMARVRQPRPPAAARSSARPLTGALNNSWAARRTRAPTFFSLGGVLYEMLTGSSPFHGESIQAVCTRVLSSTPLPPSRTNSGVPAALDEIVAKCLMKDPCASALVHVIALAEALYPLARRRVVVQAPQPVQQQQQTSSLRDRAVRLLRSA